MIKTRIVRKKIKKKRRILRTFLLTMFLVLIGGFGYYAYDIYNSSSKATNKIFHEYIPQHRETEVQVSKEPFTVLLAGIENQEGGRGRADVLMLATVNPETEQVVMMSIPRDSRVFLPDEGYKSKINHSYAFGGIEGTISTVEEMMGVPIDYFITTNFEGFEDIVDTLGGVKVDVPFTFTATLTHSHKFKKFYEGPMELNGNEALAYVRMRKKDPKGDIGRNERQQQVLKAIVDKGTSFGTITKIDDLMEDLGENVKTNIRPTKMVDFIRVYSKIKASPIENLHLEGETDRIERVDYFLPSDESIEKNKDIMNRILDGEKVDINKELNEEEEESDVSATE
ncbi:LCP family protein [Peribacillus alkalitolerans]|uniref:LCP family protein n=1 Tax=Peribacillus alkalitolerans TaxID=1550385 RepID=UPI0013CFD9CC|nr:LCP family protein [Peribacillus alkalitolerans]